MKAPNSRGSVVPIAKSRSQADVDVTHGKPASGSGGTSRTEQHGTLEQDRIGMLRIVEHRARIAAFHHLALAA